MIAVKIENLSKLYRLGTVSTRTLSHDLNRWVQTNLRGKEDPYLKVGESGGHFAGGDSDFIWALKNINLEVRQGEVLGIIGRNGAGKSTLLKILSKVTTPTSGTIKAKGRIASLLEVGTGFHPEMTGRENIFMNGSIMGMSKSEIKGKLDEIIDFAGVERYIDTPVKRYSTGMTVRLGFAVAAHLDPDILVIDEVLAVGDLEFQRKAIGKMEDITRNKGRTVLLVSHNLNSIRQLSSEAILLDNGQISYHGNTDDTVDVYIKEKDTKRDVWCVQIDQSHRKFNSGKQLEFSSVRRESDYLIASDEPIKLTIAFKRNNPVKAARLAGMINYEDNSRVGLFFSNPFDVPDQNEFEISVTLKNHNLSQGRYYLDFNIGTGDPTSEIVDYDVIYNTITFRVEYGSIKSRLPITSWKSNWGRSWYKDVDIELSKT